MINSTLCGYSEGTIKITSTLIRYNFATHQEHRLLHSELADRVRRSELAAERDERSQRRYQGRLKGEHYNLFYISDGTTSSLP